jgi:hypothetical protein
MLDKNTILLVGAVLLAGLFLYYYMGDKKSGKQEGYMAAGALDHLDSLDSRYELIQSPDQAVPAEHFADLVDSGDQAKMVQQPLGAEYVRPLERLERLHTDAQLPLTAAHLPAFNVDVANPSTYAFAVQAPRVVLKNRQAMQADMVRGDIPIRYHPDVALIGKSSLGRDSLRLDGTFSDQFKHLYNKLTGRAYKNMPLQVATQGTVMDYIQ